MTYKTIILGFLFVLSTSLALISPTSVFNVTPDFVKFNWTDNGLGPYTYNLTIGWTNSTSGKVEVVNSTVALIPKFIENIRCEFENGYQEPGTSLLTRCSHILVSPNNITNTLSDGDEENLTLLIPNVSFLYPGHYETRENMTLRTETNHSENVSITVEADIPIHLSGLCTSFGKFGNVEYKIKANNSGKQDAHYFFFNVSEIENISSILLNTTNGTELFLYDNNDVFLSSGDKIIYETAGNNSFWKVYVYGNSTDEITYQGYICGYTIHILNRTTGMDVKNIDFGLFNLSTSDRNRTAELKISNKGNYNYSLIREEYEFWKEETYTSSGNFEREIIIPPQTKKIEIELSWTGNSNYTIELINKSDDIVKRVNTHDPNQDVMDVTRKEVLTYTAPQSGLWKVKIYNNTENTDTFVVKIKVYQDVFENNLTNFTEGNITAFEEKSIDVNTTLRDYLENGNYRGYLKYFDEFNRSISTNINFSVSTAYFVFNKDINETIVKVKRNMYRNAKFNVTLIINNTGDQNITNISVEYTNLTHVSNNNCFVNITNVYYPTDLPNNSSGTVFVELDINTTNAICEGIYEGHVIFNMTNSQFHVSPSPIQKAIIQLNLTRWLNTQIIGFTPNPVNITEIDKNITIDFSVKYVNGTNFESDGIYLENITNISLISTNVTSFWKDKTDTKYYTTVSNVLNNGTNTGLFYVNFTLNKDELPGGYYNVRLSFTDKNGELKGDTTGLLEIKDEGLYVDVIYYNRTMYNGTWYWLNISITNYGTVTSSYSKLLIDSPVITDFDEITKNCTGTSTEGDNYTIIPSISPQQTCFIGIKIKTQTTSGSGHLEFKGIAGKWYNNVTKNIDVQAVGSSSSSSQESQNSNQNTQIVSSNNTEIPVIVYNLAIYSAPKLITITQGKSKTVNVDVKNKGNGTLYNITLSIEGLEQSWIKTISSKADNLTQGKTHRFSIEFEIPSSAKIGNYSFKFKIEAYPNITKYVDSVLVVEPSEEYRANIEVLLRNLNETLTNITNEYQKLKEEFGDEKYLENLTVKIQSIKDALEQAQKALESGDYIGAETYLQTAKELLNKAKNDIPVLYSIAEKKKKIKILKIIGIVLLVIIGSLIVYLLLPPPHGYEPEKGYRYVPKPHRGKPRIKKLWEEIKEKFKKKEGNLY